MAEDQVPNSDEPVEEVEQTAVTTPIEPISTEPEESVTSEPTVLLSRKQRLQQRLKQWWRNPKARYGTLGGLLVIVVLLLVLPVTRYKILGLIIKTDVVVMVRDNQSNDPVSGAKVELAGKQLQTDSKGQVHAKAHLGSVTIQASKKYYRSATSAQTITLSKQHNSFSVTLAALGRRVPVKVVNKITGKPLENAIVTIDKVPTKTDKQGLATIVVAPTVTTQKANLAGNGYNPSAVTITVGETLTTANTFGLTPTGTIYFLSNKSGKIDVVKSNLDGTNRQIVLPGTGNEDEDSTSLLASRDWKYLALLSKRGSGSNALASVYLIDTTNGDKLTTIDEGNASFALVGWSGHRFVYQVNRNKHNNWEAGAQALKSYNAETLKLTTLEQTTAEGSNDNDYGYTNFSAVYILDDELFYALIPYGSYYPNHLSGKSASLISVRPDGSNRRDIKDFPVPDGRTYSYYISLSLYEPYGVYVQVPGGDENSKYYEYEDGKLSEKPNLTQATFDKPYATYLISPSSNATFWTELRDGKNALFVGDKDAQNPKQIASLSEYQPYGWYSDDYVMVSKKSSELYILPRDGSSAPLKVTDYYKPDIDYRNYGGGYGGL